MDNFQHALRVEAPSTYAPSYHQWWFKLWSERLLAVAILIGISPFMAALAAAVRLTSSGPAIYRQRRVGVGCQPFDIYKFRSMTVDAEKGTGAVWAKPNDPRVTQLGKWLRRLHLDELPQLVNIAKGEMSFIGPRPERPEMVAILAQQISGYRQRLQVLPGVTGLAQVNLAPDETVDCVRRKFELDMEYVFTASMSLDFRIAVCTAIKMCGVPRELAARLTMVSRSPRLAPTKRRPVPGARPVTAGREAVGAV